MISPSALSITPVTRTTSSPVTTHGQERTLTIIDSISSTEAMLSSLQDVTEILATRSSVVANTLTLTNIRDTATLSSSPTSSVFISVNSASSGNQYGPSLYVGVVVVALLLVVILILIAVLVAILRTPRKNNQNTVTTYSNSSSGHYEVCRDVTDGPPTPEPSSSEPTFDDPIYNAPTPNIPPESSPSHSAVAYAVADIHTTKDHPLTANRPPSVVYDSPET